MVGLDVGRSGVKLAFFFGGEVKTYFIPSVVIPAKTITYDTNQRLTQENTVELDGVKYFVGETAIEQGAQHTVGLTQNWLEGFEHRALLLRCKSLLSSYGVVPKLIVAGLPVDTFNAYMEKLYEQVTAVFGCGVLPVPQPWGVYQDYLLNDSGRLKNSKALSERDAVIDVGHFTTDILLMSNGNWIQESSGSTIGMSKSCSELQTLLAAQGITATTIEVQEIMKSRKVKEYGSYRDVNDLVEKSILSARSQIVQFANNLLGSQARTIDRILIAGGGASSVFDEFKALWPQCILIDDPRFSVVVGMRKYGIHVALSDPSCVE